MKISDIIVHLEAIAHPSLQEDYDNAGLITGNAQWECSGALISLDATEAVILEAIEKNCNLVIAHHPIIFKGLKRINGNNYVERTVITAIKNDVAIYAIHTNLDNAQHGVSSMMAKRLGLIDNLMLLPRTGFLKKLQVFVPLQHAAAVRTALFEASAGYIGGYSECSFNSTGTGTFTGGAGTHPYAGLPGQQQQEPEVKIETVFQAWLEQKLITAMKAAHPYEEVAYDILPLENSYAGIGAGIAGRLPNPINEKDFLQLLQDVFLTPVVRHTALTGRPVQRVAVCGGAGSFLIPNAVASGMDFYVSADFKYHEFFEANGQLVIADIGHYESEQFTIDLLLGVLRDKFPTFAALKTTVNTNPVNYFV